MPFFSVFIVTAEMFPQSSSMIHPDKKTNFLIFDFPTSSVQFVCYAEILNWMQVEPRIGQRWPLSLFALFMHSEWDPYWRWRRWRLINIYMWSFRHGPSRCTYRQILETCTFWKVLGKVLEKFRYLVYFHLLNLLIKYSRSTWKV